MSCIRYVLSSLCSLHSTVPSRPSELDNNIINNISSYLYVLPYGVTVMCHLSPPSGKDLLPAPGRAVSIGLQVSPL